MWDPNDLGDRAAVLFVILNEIFAAPSQCTYSDGRNIKLTLFISVDINQNEHFHVALWGRNNWRCTIYFKMKSLKNYEPTNSNFV
jgi:hypothetical protein